MSLAELVTYGSVTLIVINVVIAMIGWFLPTRSQTKATFLRFNDPSIPTTIGLLGTFLGLWIAVKALPTLPPPNITVEPGTNANLLTALFSGLETALISTIFGLIAAFIFKIFDVLTGSSEDLDTHFQISSAEVFSTIKKKMQSYDDSIMKLRPLGAEHPSIQELQRLLITLKTKITSINNRTPDAKIMDIHKQLQTKVDDILSVIDKDGSGYKEYGQALYSFITEILDVCDGHKEVGESLQRLEAAISRYSQLSAA